MGSAATEYISAVVGVSPNSSINSIGDIVNIILNLAMGVGFSVSILTMAWSGVQYSMNKGDPKELATAFNTFLWSFFAAFISIAALSLKFIMFRLTGVDQTQPEIIQNVPNF